MDFFALFEEVAAWSWKMARGWDHFAQNTVGEQLVRATDSINANLVEGDGRYSTGDSVRFCVIAHASAREAKRWIQRAIDRNLCDPDDGQVQIEKLVCGATKLNGLINYRTKAKREGLVKEERTSYSKLDPFIDD